jgi:hypothetical protein
MGGGGPWVSVCLLGTACWLTAWLAQAANQGVKQAIIVVPEKAIGASFHDEPLSKFGFWADWRVEPKWNLCNAPGDDNGGKVKSVGAFLESTDKVPPSAHRGRRKLPLPSSVRK